MTWQQTWWFLFNCGQIDMDWDIEWTVVNFCLWGRVMRLRPRILGSTSFVDSKTTATMKNIGMFLQPDFFFPLSQRLSWTLDSLPSATIKNPEPLSCLRWRHKTLKNARCPVGHRSSKHNSFCHSFEVFDRLGGLLSLWVFFPSLLLKGSSVYL